MITNLTQILAEKVTTFSTHLITPTVGDNHAKLALTSVQTYGKNMTFFNFKVVEHGADPVMNGLSPRGLGIKDPETIDITTAKGVMERNITVQNIQNLLETFIAPKVLANLAGDKVVQYLIDNCIGMHIAAKITVNTKTQMNNIYPQSVKAVK
tara:strand:+ start:48 stop:506 length:459 start_codon:yes stop_codon:yes gene_type:complete